MVRVMGYRNCIMMALPVLDDSADVVYQRLQSKMKRAVEATGVLAREYFFAADDMEREGRWRNNEGVHEFDSGQYRQKRLCREVMENVLGRDE